MLKRASRLNGAIAEEFDLLANGVQAAISHVLHERLGTAGIVVVFAGAEINIGPAGKVARFLSDVRASAQSAGKKSHLTESAGVGARCCVFQQLIKFFTRQKGFFKWVK